jgi:hypothetical protein
MHGQHFLRKISPAIVAGAVFFTAAAVSGEDTAAINKSMVLAQAGSTGGTIGKQEKSASGGEVPARARRAHPARQHHEAARAHRVHLARQHRVSEAAQGRAKAKGIRCPNIVGVWNSWASGLFGQADTTFFKNGTARHKSGIPGKWYCAGGELRMTWGNEGRYDRMTVAPDGKRITNSDGIVGFSR